VPPEEVVVPSGKMVSAEETEAVFSFISKIIESESVFQVPFQVYSYVEVALKVVFPLILTCVKLINAVIKMSLPSKE